MASMADTATTQMATFTETETEAGFEMEVESALETEMEAGTSAETDGGKHRAAELANHIRRQNQLRQYNIILIQLPNCRSSPDQPPHKAYNCRFCKEDDPRDGLQLVDGIYGTTNQGRGMTLSGEPAVITRATSRSSSAEDDQELLHRQV
ncbi:hypothetical protein CONLIGDRAFT_686769 [Coniochaeta ligniaria NRRL 30616]|uniref:Uncharacterized protein n=1 Tax=Coniochaeta ligniaria NRRL 30616 TaxID=1408157 RepID=A0A1J7J0D0_9PEZI|nr:hypothetical protein CONLIGDRAFT_686769 [Coniochaeta ligniaria NRRL 30616]